jgi:hypothetical protein
MGEFFKGWRRQLGLRTLVVACVFMAGWVRSLTTTDQLIGKEFFGQLHSFGSQSGAFYWIRLKPCLPPVPATPPIPDLDRHSLARKLGFLDIEIRQNSGGMTMLAGNGIGVPYWIITIPLTILSAFLLLSKPRPSTPKKTPEPISEKMT